jgi:hypothetical protein
VSASVLLIIGLVLTAAASGLLTAALRLRRRVRVAAGLLTRATAALGEAERAGRLY